MTFEENTGLSIQTAFNAFHEKNPIVYEHFKKRVQEAIDAKKTKGSSKIILGVIKWDIYMETDDDAVFTDKTGKKKRFRINDAYSSRYARLYAEEFYQDRIKKDFFDFREIRSE